MIIIMLTVTHFCDLKMNDSPTIRKNTWFCLIAFSVFLWGCSSKNDSVSEYPRKPIKLIVPFTAGAGSDTFSRILQKAIEDHEFLPQPLVIINVPGTGGTIGSRRVKNARPDGYTIMQLHEGILTSKYSGMVNYGPEAFEPIAAMGQSTMVIGVGDNSPFADLGELMQAATENPDSVIFAANIGAPSQFAGLMLENVSPGAQFRYAQTGDGAERFAGLQGGHTDVSAFSLAEYVQFRDGGLKAIALLGKSRNPDAEEIPTAIEQGFDVVSTNMQFWWAPKGTPPERRELIAKTLEQAMQTEQVRERLAALNMAPVFLSGAELKEEIAERSRLAAAVTQRPVTKLPNFPLLVAGIAVALALTIVVRHGIGHERNAIPQNQLPENSPQPGFSTPLLACLVVLVTATYVALMQFEIVAYRLATIGYVMGVGGLLTARNPRLLTYTGTLAIVLGLGLHYIFTNVFVIDLP